MSDEKTMGKVFSNDAARVWHHHGEMLGGAVEETLSAWPDQLR